MNCKLTYRQSQGEPYLACISEPILLCAILISFGSYNEINPPNLNKMNAIFLIGSVLKQVYFYLVFEGSANILTK